jgi:hypothetical protein
MTPNGGYCWYTLLAPLLGWSTRHLSTDRFLGRREAVSLLQFADLRLIGCDFWTFIPKADMPRWTGVILEHEHAAAFQNSGNLAKGLVPIKHVLQRPDTKHNIHGRVVDRAKFLCRIYA